jgi:hypothetical protein
MNTIEKRELDLLILKNSYGREYSKENITKNQELQGSIENSVTNNRGYSPLSTTIPSGLGFSKQLFNEFRKFIGLENIFDVYSTLAQMEVRDRKNSTDPSEIGERGHMNFCSRFLIDEQLFLFKGNNFKGFQQVASDRSKLAHINYSDCKKIMRIEGDRQDNIEYMLT